MGKGGELGAREVCKDEGKEDGRILARFAACVASRVGIEGLWRGQEEMVMSCWGDHGYFVDGTPEGRQAMCAVAGALCLDSLERRGYWRGGGAIMRGQTSKGGTVERGFTKVTR